MRDVEAIQKVGNQWDRSDGRLPIQKRKGPCVWKVRRERGPSQVAECFRQGERIGGNHFCEKGEGKKSIRPGKQTRVLAKRPFLRSINRALEGTRQ